MKNLYYITVASLLLFSGVLASIHIANSDFEVDTIPLDHPNQHIRMAPTNWTVGVDYSLTPPYRTILISAHDTAWGGGTPPSGKNYVGIHSSSGISGYLQQNIGFHSNGFPLSFFARRRPNWGFCNVVLEVSYCGTTYFSQSLSQEWTQFSIPVLPTATTCGSSLLKFKSVTNTDDCTVHLDAVTATACPANTYATHTAAFPYLRSRSEELIRREPDISSRLLAQTPQLSWSERGAYKAWSNIAFSADGATVVAAVGQGDSVGGIFRSLNGGETWFQTSAPDKNWYGLASSADGLKLAAVVHNGPVFTSIDGGVSWQETSAPSNSWVNIASSPDGTTLAVIGHGTYIYVSSDNGLTWSRTGTAGGWNRIVFSSDGTKIIAVSGDPKQMVMSTNAGVSWTLLPAPALNWNGIASSADGSTLAAIPYGGFIQISYDGGSTWNSKESYRWWTGITCSSDGTRLAASDMAAGNGYVGPGGYIYVSVDSGHSWTQTGSVQRYQSIAASLDGSVIGAVSAYSEGYIYIGVIDVPTAYPTAEPTVPSTVPSNGENTCVCIRGFVLSSTGTCIRCPLGSSTIQDGSNDCIPMDNIAIISEKRCFGLPSTNNILVRGSIKVKFMNRTEEKMVVFSKVDNSFYDNVKTIEVRLVVSHKKHPIGESSFGNILTKENDELSTRYLLEVPKSRENSFSVSFPSCREYKLGPHKYISKLRLKFFSVTPQEMLLPETILGCTDILIDRFSSQGSSLCSMPTSYY